MRYTAVITAKVAQPEKFFEAIKNEADKKDRSELSISRLKKDVIFEISSKDHTALKASVNTALKIISIYEKTEKLIENGK